MYIEFTYEYGDHRYLEFYDEVNTEAQVRKQYPKLTEMDWDWICMIGNLSWEFIQEFEEHINWYALSKNTNLDEKVINVYKSKLEWDDIWRYHNLTEEFIEHFIHYMESIPFIENNTNNYQLIHKFAKHLNWYEISSNAYICTDEFVREFKDYLDWDVAIKNGKIYEDDLLREFLPKMNLNLLVFQQLSWQGKENLLRELKNKIKWDKYLNEGYPVYDGHMEIYDWWWSKKRAKRERLKK